MQLNAILACEYLLLYAIHEYCKYIKSGRSEKQQNEFEITLTPGIFPALPSGESAPNSAEASFKLPCGGISLIRSTLKC